ncbi:hypothetical protein D3C81_2084860 [compost metagenome]
MNTDAFKHTLRQFLATVHRDLPGPMLQCRVGEAGNQAVSIRLQIDTSDAQGRSLLLHHQAQRRMAEIIVLHAVANVFITRQIPEISEKRVATV